NDYLAEQKIDNFEILTRYLFDLGNYSFNLTFADLQNDFRDLYHNTSTENKLNKLNNRVDDVRIHISAVICQSFDILKSFDSGYFEDKFQKNTDEFRDQVYRFWDKKITIMKKIHHFH
ncbi:MAG: hypothetical protein DCF12_15175, partial [Snowella sp.]